MASDDNPFAAGSDAIAEPSSVGTLEPVPMDVGPILERCWMLFRDNAGIVLAAILLGGGVKFGFSIVDTGVRSAENAYPEQAQALATLSVVLNIASGLLSFFFQVGLTRVFLNLASGLPVDASMLWGGGAQFPSALGSALVRGVAIVLGGLALIVPGVLIALGTQFYLYCLVDRDQGPIEALMESWRITDGYKATVFGLNLVMGLVGLALGCATLGVGFFVMIPVLSLTQAVMYHSLRQRFLDRFVPYSAP